MCGVITSQYNIGAHVKKHHGLDPEQYRIDNGLKPDPSKPIMIDCPGCDKQFVKNRIQNYCSPICKTNHKKRKKYGDKLLHCPYCEWTGRTMTRHLLRFHPEVSLDEYREKHGNLWCDESRKTFSDNMQGEKNPGAGHGGRLSPFSKKFVGYDGLSEEEKEKERQKVYETEGYKNRVMTSHLEYWLEKFDGDEVKARRALSERQTTFSLERCIERWGKDEGTRRWQDRQDRWQETLKSKPQEEIDRINVSKGNNPLGFGFNFAVKHEPGTLYYIKITSPDGSESWKIGITSRTIEDRFGRRDAFMKTTGGAVYEVIDTMQFDKMLYAYEFENKILRKFEEHRFKLILESFSTTETFDKNILEGTTLHKMVNSLKDKRTKAIIADPEVTLFDFG